MTGFYIFIEKHIDVPQLRTAMKEIFPALKFYEWYIQENIIDGVKDRELNNNDILMEVTHLPGIFKTRVEYYRFPGEKIDRTDLLTALKLAAVFNCQTTIDGYSYCDFDQMPDYSLLLDNGKAYFIGDCYAGPGWQEDDERIKQLGINIIEEIDISEYIKARP